MKTLLVFGVVAMATTLTMGNLIVNPGFEDDPYEPTIPGWTLSGGAYIYDGNPYEGGFSLLLDGANQRAEQSVLSLSGWQGSTITASAWINLYSEQFNPSAIFYFGAIQRDSLGDIISTHESPGISTTTGFEQTVLGFTGAPELDRIEIYFRTDSGSGREFSVDNVSLVPEPSTMSMLGMGALAILLRRRMRK
ncbi:MAG TPA: PEP-CTERM sorting domain-containing protein [Kiritimatiellia bacterium]|nr:PEP-CTERM sorting domain-containing protein [Kiritimatiellia bacterium]